MSQYLLDRGSVGGMNEDNRAVSGVAIAKRAGSLYAAAHEQAVE